MKYFNLVNKLIYAVRLGTVAFIFMPMELWRGQSKVHILKDDFWH